MNMFLLQIRNLCEKNLKLPSKTASFYELETLGLTLKASINGIVCQIKLQLEIHENYTMFQLA